MSYLTIPPQEFYFYEGEWSDDAVNCLINILIDEKAQGNWKVGGNNFHSLRVAQDSVNGLLNKNFTSEGVIEQLKKLKQRYETFKAVLDLDGVERNRKINHVYATGNLWITIIKCNPFAKSFFHKGDKQFDNLEALFGGSESTWNGVILLSDGDSQCGAQNTALNPLVLNDSEDEDEIVSPDWSTRKMPCKKLFADEIGDRGKGHSMKESNYSSNGAKFDGFLRGKPIYPPRNAFRPKPANLQLVDENEKVGSSVASCSPVKLD